jgi:hypothetical protein
MKQENERRERVKATRNRRQGYLEAIAPVLVSPSGCLQRLILRNLIRRKQKKGMRITRRDQKRVEACLRSKIGTIRTSRGLRKWREIDFVVRFVA